MQFDSALKLEAGEIHLWFTDDTQCNNNDLLAQYHSLLNSAERTQQQRFYFAKHRHQYLVSRALIRSVLSHYETSVSPAQWRFQKNAYGKPFQTNIPTSPLKFNLSHTDKLVVLAVTLNNEVGVDVENWTRSGSTIEIADRFFSPIETQTLLNLPADQQRARFFDLWTLKEAYIKACGMGLSIPLNHFSYSFSDDSVSIAFAPERNDDAQRWNFWQVCPSDSHTVSIAIKDTSVTTLSMRQILPLSEIVEIDYPITRQPCSG